MVWTEEYSYFYSMYILFWLKSKCPYNIERVATTDVDKLYMGPGKVIVVIKLNVPTGISNFVEDTFCITGPCKGNPLVTSGFPNKGRMTRGSGVSCGVNKLLNNSRVTSDLRCHDAHLTSLQCNVTIYGLYRFQLQLASSKNRKQLKILLWNLSDDAIRPQLALHVQMTHVCWQLILRHFAESVTCCVKWYRNWGLDGSILANI